MDETSAHVFIKKDNQYSIVKPDGMVTEMSGRDILSSMNTEGKDSATRSNTRKGR